MISASWLVQQGIIPYLFFSRSLIFSVILGLTWLILVWPVLLVQVLPKWFFLPKPGFFGLYLKFQRLKSLKNEYLPPLEPISYQINSIISCLSRSFQQHEKFQFLRNFQIRFNLIFSEEIISIFKNFCTSSPNIMEPSPFSYDLFLFSGKKLFQYSKTFAPQVQTSWNQAHSATI